MFWRYIGPCCAYQIFIPDQYRPRERERAAVWGFLPTAHRWNHTLFLVLAGTWRQKNNEVKRYPFPQPSYYIVSSLSFFYRCLLENKCGTFLGAGGANLSHSAHPENLQVLARASPVRAIFRRPAPQECIGGVCKCDLIDSRNFIICARWNWARRRSPLSHTQTIRTQFLSKREQNSADWPDFSYFFFLCARPAHLQPAVCPLGNCSTERGQSCMLKSMAKEDVLFFYRRIASIEIFLAAFWSKAHSRNDQTSANTRGGRRTTFQ